MKSLFKQFPRNILKRFPQPSKMDTAIKLKLGLNYSPIPFRRDHDMGEAFPNGRGNVPDFSLGKRIELIG